jgi:hypothetical protein
LKLAKEECSFTIAADRTLEAWRDRGAERGVAKLRSAWCSAWRPLRCRAVLIREVFAAAGPQQVVLARSTKAAETGALVREL